MSPDPDRLTLAVSALAGGAFWGLYHLGTALLAGQPVGRQDLILAVANVAIGILGGGLAAYFLGPVLMDLVPTAALQDPHAVGFGIGAGAWEAAPFAYRALRNWAGKRAKGAAK